MSCTKTGIHELLVHAVQNICISRQNISVFGGINDGYKVMFYFVVKVRATVRDEFGTRTPTPNGVLAKKNSALLYSGIATMFAVASLTRQAK